MNTKHTPGEWDIRYERDHFDSAQSTLRIIDPTTTGHPQGPVTLATINVAAFAPHMEEPLANARLMVAAPELLGMLREAVRLAELNRPMEADTLRAAKAAIAKASHATIIEDE